MMDKEQIIKIKKLAKKIAKMSECVYCEKPLDPEGEWDMRLHKGKKVAFYFSSNCFCTPPPPSFEFDPKLCMGCAKTKEELIKDKIKYEKITSINSPPFIVCELCKEEIQYISNQEIIEEHKTESTGRIIGPFNENSICYECEGPMTRPVPQFYKDREVVFICQTCFKKSEAVSKIRDKIKELMFHKYTPQLRVTKSDESYLEIIFELLREIEKIQATDCLCGYSYSEDSCPKCGAYPTPMF